eukprot:gene4294-8534_t
MEIPVEQKQSIIPIDVTIYPLGCTSTNSNGESILRTVVDQTRSLLISINAPVLAGVNIVIKAVDLIMSIASYISSRFKTGSLTEDEFNLLHVLDFQSGILYRAAGSKSCIFLQSLVFIESAQMEIFLTRPIGSNNCAAVDLVLRPYAFPMYPEQISSIWADDCVVDRMKSWVEAYDNESNIRFAESCQPQRLLPLLVQCNDGTKFSFYQSHPSIESSHMTGLEELTTGDGVVYVQNKRIVEQVTNTDSRKDIDERDIKRQNRGHEQQLLSIFDSDGSKSIGDCSVIVDDNDNINNGDGYLLPGLQPQQLQAQAQDTTDDTAQVTELLSRNPFTPYESIFNTNDHMMNN